MKIQNAIGKLKLFYNDYLILSLKPCFGNKKILLKK